MTTKPRLQGAAAGTGLGGILGAAVAEAFNFAQASAQQDAFVELLQVMAEKCGGG